MSESSKVPNIQAEVALLLEMSMTGSEVNTGYIVSKAMAYFQYLQTAEAKNKKTPSGRPWWPGRFRFDLTNLKRLGEAENVVRGHWRITQKGRDKLKVVGNMLK